MHVDRYEKLWMAISITFLVMLMLIIGYTAYAHGVHVPHESAAHTPESEPTEREPGVYQIGDNEYEVVIHAKVWSFTPGEIKIPQGAKVHFILTSEDIIHGFYIPGTTVNSMAVPGQETRFTYEFNKPGEYLILCHEYCGTGHHMMVGKIIVE